MILPIYQEAGIIENSLSRLHTVLASSGDNFEIIVADDGSKDHGAAIVSRFAADFQRVRLIRHPANRGRGFILMRAIEQAAGSVIAYIDADLQIDPEAIPRLADTVRRGADIAIGSKYHLNSSLSYSLWRRLQSSVYCALVRICLDLETNDCQCGAKAFRREVILHLLPHLTCCRWSWDTEVILKSSLLGYRIEEVPVTVRHDPTRKSKVRIGSSVTMTWHLISLWNWSRLYGRTFFREHAWRLREPARPPSRGQ